MNEWESKVNETTLWHHEGAVAGREMRQSGCEGMVTRGGYRQGEQKMTERERERERERETERERERESERERERDRDREAMAVDGWPPRAFMLLSVHLTLSIHPSYHPSI
eukprot:GHVU01195031.1.p2 GENE.GHVU01195031.1~~GHVU01195031.1.p2  ORF type:complete len:110 (+),score=24.51 GHVU01195031.1:84-413(+)